MAEDSRKSGRRSGDSTDISGGDGSLVTILELRDEETLALNEVKLEYDPAGTTNATVEIYDEDSGINQGDESDIVDKFHLTPGDRVNPDMVWPDIEDDVIATTGGNQDAAITITVGGHVVTG